MMQMSRQDYVDLPVKTASGVPTQFYVDYQRAAATMYVWPVPSSVTVETVQYTFQRSFEDIDALTNDLDIPQEYLEVVGYALADRIQDQFKKDIPKITQRAALLMAQASDADREDTVTFMPDFSR